MMAVILMIFLVTGLLAWPIWTGEVFSTEGIIPSMRVTIPQYYYEAAEWLNQQNEDFSLLPFPYPAKTTSSVFWWQNGTEGYYGVYPFLLLSSKTFLMTSNVAEALARSLARGELKNSRVFNYLNVKYIVVHWDANWEYLKDHNWWISTSPQNLSLFLANVHGLLLEKSFGKIDFYRNLYWSPQRVKVIPKAEYLNTSLLSLVSVLGRGSFEKRMEIVLHQENEDAINNVMLSLNITHQDGMLSDFSNLLFTFFNESTRQETRIPHLIENSKNDMWALVWIRVPAFDENKTCRIFLYYGGNITQNSSPEAFFRFHDNFEGSNFGKQSIAESGCKISTNFSYTLGKVQSLWPSLSSYISYLRISPTKYYIRLNVSEPSNLILAEPFEKEWTVEGGPYTFEHFSAMESLNGWSIDSQGNYSVTIVYGLQSVLDYSLAISLTAFVIAVALLAGFEKTFLPKIRLGMSSSREHAQMGIVSHPKELQKSSLLIVTPEMAGGSWVSIYELVRTVFPNTKITVVTLGHPKETPHGMLAFKLPYPSYQKLGPHIGSNPLFVLLYKVPLFLMSTIVSFIYRPKIIIGNGFMTSIACVFSARIIRARIVASFHGHIRHTICPSIRNIIRALCHSFDLVTVNSIGSKEDASLVVDPSKILLVEHSADDIFFQKQNRERLRKEMGLEDKFVILYVGRMDIEKVFDTLLEVFRQLRVANDIVLLVVGSGKMEKEVRSLEKKTASIRYFGYLTDKRLLAALYKVADIVWSYADETYLARPAVEALASGTPIMIPNRPAILKKAKAGIKIDPKLVPPEIGWIVDPSDISAIVQLILSIKAQKSVLYQMRDRCVEYARKKYSTERLRGILAKLAINLS
ncbi:MAG: DUF2341 domain-containing protein [Candidatus Brockarchaeota archaeon]|nr:DUF2341 domain-containing protein [Candidatus Brockarchaeota archaeon]